jgi:hypothetical protein
MEGFASFMLGNLREIFSSGLLRRLAYLLIRKKLTAIRERLDPSEYGGAPLLGVNGVAIIAHGSSNARAIRNAIRAAADESLVGQVNSDIIEILAVHSPATMIAKPSSKGIRGLFGRVRERLHIHREAHPERKLERFGKGDKSGRHEHLDHLDAVHPEGPVAPLSHDEHHADAANHTTPVATVSPTTNGAVVDAYGTSAEPHEPHVDDHDDETAPHEGHTPKGGHS